MHTVSRGLKGRAVDGEGEERESSEGSSNNMAELVD